jgi:hypothetical protein
VRTKARLDLAQALSKRELRKCHAQKLIEAAERPYAVLAAVTRDATPKRAQRQMLGQLRENQLAFVHPALPGSGAAQGDKTCAGCSNRDQAKSPFMHAASVAYRPMKFH